MTAARARPRRRFDAPATDTRAPFRDCAPLERCTAEGERDGGSWGPDATAEEEEMDSLASHDGGVERLLPPSCRPTNWSMLRAGTLSAAEIGDHVDHRGFPRISAHVIR